MKHRSIHYGTTIPALLMALALTCLCCLTAQAVPPPSPPEGSPIVGLWNVHYFQGTTELFQTYDQWHSDGLEFEVNSIAPGAVCQGTWRNIAHDSVKLFHVIWTFDANGVLNGHIEEIQINTVSHGRNTYQGTFDQKFYDLDGHLTGEATGTLSATRLSVP